MTTILPVLFAVYIPIPADKNVVDEATPDFLVYLYGIGYVLSCLIMYWLIRKSRRDKRRGIR
jgi:hypothetical protein